MRKLLANLALLLAMATPAMGQEFWEKRPYTEWSKEQCLKLLHDSPWAKTFTITYGKVDQFGQPTKGEARQTEQKIFYYAQLRSALPVRQAVVRLAQIQNRYDKMSVADRRDFDASTARFLGAQYDTIIVHVDYETDVEFFDRDLAAYWQGRTPGEAINDSVYLTTSQGTRVTPKDFKVQHGAARAFEYTFPREVNGEPFVTASVESIRLEFPNPKIRELDDQRTTFEFRTSKMKYKGEVIY